MGFNDEMLLSEAAELCANAYAVHCQAHGFLQYAAKLAEKAEDPRVKAALQALAGEDPDYGEVLECKLSDMLDELEEEDGALTEDEL